MAAGSQQVASARVASLLFRFYRESYLRNLGVRFPLEALEASIQQLERAAPPTYADWRPEFPEIELPALHTYRAVQAMQSRVRMLKPNESRDAGSRRGDEGIAVLDFGCGDGPSGYIHNLFHIRVLVGVDTSFRGSSVRAALDEYRVASLREAEHVCSQYDLLIASFVLHHLPSEDVEGIFSDFRRLVRLGGKIFDC